MLDIKSLSKHYTQNAARIDVIKNVDLLVKDREFIALVGPSGCGKSTLLKIISGLMGQTSGDIMLDGEKIIGPGKDRGLVFQSFTLFPWLTVRQNISFGLELQNMAAARKKEITDHYLEITGLAEFANFYPKNLSGGMQQRVAIARTLANDPKILLMDEPFGALDSQTRSQMQEFLTKLWEKEHKTIVFITHDVGEAVFLADTVYVLTDRPMQIKKVFTVPFPRPRLHGLKQTQEFFEFTNQVTKELENG